MKTLALLLLLACSAACSDRQATSDSQSSNGVRAFATTSRPKLALTDRVTDAAEILDAAQEASLSRQLEHLERATGHQMVVVTVPTLGGQDIAAFTRELGNAWGIGRAEEDDGVVLLVAPHERKARIAVGYGLEQKLSDTLCQQIMARDIIPHFRQGDLPGGIDAGVKALVSQLQ